MLLGRDHFAGFDLHLPAGLCHCPQQAGQQGLHGRRNQPQAQYGLAAAFAFTGTQGRLLGTRQYDACIFQQRLACSSELHAARQAGEELRADLVLELLELL